MITIFGATGFTGRQIVEELSRLQVPSDKLRLAGRSAEKLSNLSNSLPDNIPWVAVDAKDPSSIALLIEDTNVLINCVGPFTDMGEPIVSLAAVNGVHYLDITNELGFVFRMQSYNDLAKKTNAAIVPACGIEVVLADCAASILANNFDSRINRIDIKYTLGGTITSQGTRQSAIRSLGTSWFKYSEGKFTSALPCRETITEMSDNNQRSFISFPSSESVTIPSHIDVKNVNVWLAIPSHARLWAPILLPFLAILARGPISKLMLFVSSTIFRDSPLGSNIHPAFSIKVEAKTDDNLQSITIKGQNVYATTAKIAAYVALQMIQPEYSPSGVLAPSAALNPDAVLKYGEDHWGLNISRSQGN